MAKQALERPTQWQANSKFTPDKYTNPTKDKASFRGPFKNYGKRSNNTKANTLLKPHTQKSTISRLRICSIFNQECCIVDGTLLMDSSLKT